MSIRICYIRVLDTVPGTENNSSWRQELLLFFFLTEYNYHFSDISIEWVKVHLDTVRFNLWHVIWGKFTYLWELSCKLTFSRIYINDLWIISQKKVWILWNQIIALLIVHWRVQFIIYLKQSYKIMP